MRRAFTPEQLADRDPLTGLHNRRAVDDRLLAIGDDPARASAELLLIDIDKLKQINDTHVLSPTSSRLARRGAE